jgi:hypothetical protein
MKYKLFCWCESTKKYFRFTQYLFENKHIAIGYAVKRHKLKVPVTIYEKWKLENESEKIEFTTELEINVNVINSEITSKTGETK